jgi:hypothetical protein
MSEGGGGVCFTRDTNMLSSASKHVQSNWEGCERNEGKEV